MLKELYVGFLLLLLSFLYLSHLTRTDLAERKHAAGEEAETLVISHPETQLLAKRTTY